MKRSLNLNHGVIKIRYVHSLNKNSLSDLPKLLCQIRHRVRRLRHLSLMGNPFSPEFVADAQRREFMTQR